MRISTPDDAAALLLPFFEGAEEERVVALHLDSGRRLIGLTRESQGGAEDVELPVAALLGNALKLGAVGIVVAHNHPSGDPGPSAGDLDTTRRLAETASAMGVRLHDHLIYGGGQWRSFAALGLL